ncbi:hypothetical protein L7F22_041085 [Adiantum nelumboides]|nr:hypothetical protein [Adiantum nelumboides]
MTSLFWRGLFENMGTTLKFSSSFHPVTHRGRAVGIEFQRTKGPRKGEKLLLQTKKAVVSNASVWDTASLLPDSELFSRQATSTPKTDSFMHLHLGIKASGLPSDLECHHLVLNDWSIGISAPQNVCIVSIPSVFDPSLAPPGHHVVHAYTAGNEPYDIWRGMDHRSPEYAIQKEVRSEVLWRTLEKVIPDVRERVKVKLVGSPLTHERYLRRHEGTYGPAIKAGEMSFPGPYTSIPGLLCCGDSTMPGIGVPAVAASGLIAAHSLVPFWDHLRLLDSLEGAI